MSADAAMKGRKPQLAETSQPRHSGAVRSSIADGTRNPALVAHVHHKAPGSTSGPWQIPSTWRWSTMGAEAEVVGGGTPRTNRSDYFGGDVPWITPADLSGYTEKFIPKGARNITQAGLEGSGAKLVPTGTVLFSSRAPIGYVAIAANPVSTNQGFKSFVLRGNLTPDFVYYYLKHAKKLALELASGTTFQEISGKNAARIPVPVPPLAEQRQIVAEIEKQFTRLDAGVAALRRVQANLKRYRAAILKAACEGRLIPTEAELAKAEGRTYETGEQLLARILADRRKNWHGRGKYKEPAAPDATNLPPLPQGWMYTSIDPLLDTNSVGMKTGPFGSLLKKSEHRDSGVPIIGIENIGTNGRFAHGSKIHVTAQKAHDLEAYELLAGDVVISRSGTVGELCVIPESVGTARFSTNIMMVRLAPSCSSAYFCFLFAGSPIVLDQVKELCKGSTRAFLNQHILKSIVFPLPPLVEQLRIVAEVERRLSIVEELEVAVAANLQRAIRLRQSILQRAFAVSATV